MILNRPAEYVMNLSEVGVELIEEARLRAENPGAWAVGDVFVIDGARRMVIAIEGTDLVLSRN